MVAPKEASSAAQGGARKPTERPPVQTAARLARSLAKIMAATKYASYSAPSLHPPGPGSSQVSLRLTPDAGIAEPCRARLRRQVDVAQIDQHVATHAVT